MEWLLSLNLDIKERTSSKVRATVHSDTLYWKGADRACGKVAHLNIGNQTQNRSAWSPKNQDNTHTAAIVLKIARGSPNVWIPSQKFQMELRRSRISNSEIQKNLTTSTWKSEMAAPRVNIVKAVVIYWGFSSSVYLCLTKHKIFYLCTYCYFRMHKTLPNMLLCQQPQKHN